MPLKRLSRSIWFGQRDGEIGFKKKKKLPVAFASPGPVLHIILFSLVLSEERSHECPFFFQFPLSPWGAEHRPTFFHFTATQYVYSTICIFGFLSLFTSPLRSSFFWAKIYEDNRLSWREREKKICESSSFFFLFISLQIGRRVDDQFEDLRDGHNLVSLLEVLSGDHLVRMYTN